MPIDTSPRRMLSPDEVEAVAAGMYADQKGKRLSPYLLRWVHTSRLSVTSFARKADIQLDRHHLLSDRRDSAVHRVVRA